MELARLKTNIPTPRVRRTAVDTDEEVYVLMEYVDGTQLAQCWSRLSIWRRLHVAFTLHRYIRRLRQIHSEHSSVPGPIGETAQLCDGPIFGHRYRGPFQDYASLSAFYNRMLAIAKSLTPHFAASPETKPFDDSKPLVFTHGDLSMRNILLGTDGRLCLVGWGSSGFYPPWFEYVATVYAARNDEAPESWRSLVPLITDPYFTQEQWVKEVMYTLTIYK
jgi:aminoglycoside phosphotransferase (APT) family kinase protein